MCFKYNVFKETEEDKHGSHLEKVMGEIFLNVADLIKQWCHERGYEVVEPFDYHPDSKSYMEIDDKVIIKLFNGKVSYLSHNPKARVEPSGIRRMTLGDVSDPEFFSKLQSLIDEATYEK